MARKRAREREEKENKKSKRGKNSDKKQDAQSEEVKKRRSKRGKNSNKKDVSQSILSKPKPKPELKSAKPKPPKAKPVKSKPSSKPFSREQNLRLQALTRKYAPPVLGISPKMNVDMASKQYCEEFIMHAWRKYPHMNIAKKKTFAKGKANDIDLFAGEESDLEPTSDETPTKSPTFFTAKAANKKKKGENDHHQFGRKTEEHVR